MEAGEAPVEEGEEAGRGNMNERLGGPRGGSPNPRISTADGESVESELTLRARMGAGTETESLLDGAERAAAIAAVTAAHVAAASRAAFAALSRDAALSRMRGTFCSSP